MPSVTETPSHVTTTEIISVRDYDAPRELVFQAWSDPGHLQHWWGPQGFRSTFHEFDFRAGGHWRFVLHGPDGTNYDNHIIFVEIDPPARIVLDHISAPKLRATATFEALGPRKTRLTFRGDFLTPETLDAVKGFAFEGNRQTLVRLGEELARMAG
jgi:uncharacterized protein YndB with AHSA1/START domain